MLIIVSAFREQCDYSNFDTDQWEPRTNQHHIGVAQKYRACNTRAAQKKLEREFGIRYSVLLELPYLDPV